MTGREEGSEQQNEATDRVVQETHFRRSESVMRCMKEDDVVDESKVFMRLYLLAGSRPLLFLSALRRGNETLL